MGEYKTQTRTIGPLPPIAETRIGDIGAFTRWGGLPSYLTPTQTTTSYRSNGVQEEWSKEAIAEFLDVSRNGFTEPSTSYDTGHTFHTTKTSVTISHPHWKSYGFNTAGKKEWIRGPLWPLNDTSDSSRVWGDFPAVPTLTTADAAKYGATAVANTAPTNPSANLATFLGEAILSGLPSRIGASLFQDRARALNSVGNEYLNVAFGWLPLVSDIKSTAQAISNSAKIIKQYKRDSGRLVRRRYAFPQTKSASQPVRCNRAGNTLWFPNRSSMPYQYDAASGIPDVFRENHKITDMWFSGAFTYHLEADDSVMGEVERFEQLANHLLGTRLTPSVLWELAPWSWFGDYFGTMGDLFQSASLMSSDGLVMKYGYLMRRTRESNTYSIPSGVTFSGGIKTGPITVTLSRETKERVKATPYGFGAALGDLSPRQWAVMGALGLTKAPRSLH